MHVLILNGFTTILMFSSSIKQSDGLSGAGARRGRSIEASLRQSSRHSDLAMHLARLFLCLSLARHSKHAHPLALCNMSSDQPIPASFEGDSDLSSASEEVPMLPPPQNHTEGSRQSDPTTSSDGMQAPYGPFSWVRD